MTADDSLEKVKRRSYRPQGWNFTIGIVVSLLIALFAAELECYYSLEDLEHIGAYVTGFGQLVAIVWIIVTFRSQMEDIALQREELSQQRRALENTSNYTQQALALEIFKFNKKRLDALARTIISYAESDASLMQKLSSLYSHGNDDAYIECLCRSDELQSRIRERLLQGDEIIYASMNDYVMTYDSIVQNLSHIDLQGNLSIALVAESFVLEFKLIAELLMRSFQLSEVLSDDGM